MTAPAGGVASGFLRHWTGPASSTREFQGFNINLKTISSDMVHGLTQSLHGCEQLKLRDPSHFFCFLVLIFTGFYILTLRELGVESLCFHLRDSNSSQKPSYCIYYLGKLPKKNVFFGKSFPNVGGWGGCFPNKVQTPQNPPKSPRK